MADSVSVVIPLYNRAGLMAQAVACCAAQTHRPAEVVFVDDGSADAPDVALAALNAGDGVRLIRHERNKGVSAARNTGVREARSEFVAFLDSDDSWAPAKLERQLATVAAAPDPQRTVCLTLTQVVTSAGTSIKPARIKPDDESWGDFVFLGGGFGQTSSFFLARALALACPFDESLRQYEDYNLLLTLEAAGAKTVFTPEALTTWYDDDRPGRIGAADNVARGDHFLAVAADRLSPRARAAFEARYIGPAAWRTAPGRTLGAVARGLAIGALSPADAAKVAARCLLPPERHAAIKRALGRGGR